MLASRYSSSVAMTARTCTGFALAEHLEAHRRQQPHQKCSSACTVRRGQVAAVPGGQLCATYAPTYASSELTKHTLKGNHSIGAAGHRDREQHRLHTQAQGGKKAAVRLL